MRYLTFCIGLVASLAFTGFSATAWDSVKRNPTHPTHSYLTEWAIGEVDEAECKAFSKQLLDGSNEELHELPVSGSKYGIDLDNRRLAHKGTNAGTNDIKGWWSESLAAYRAGQKDKAYFLLGILLHMVEDMGVPAHANGIYHQGTVGEFDNFEFMALSNWKPDFAAVDRSDPAFADPSDYYEFSRAWARADAPDYRDRDSFSKFWATASRAERDLLRNRQARTANVTSWTLKSALRAYGRIP